MTNLRKQAAHRTCQVRLEGVCQAREGDCCLAHVRMVGVSGMGVKAPDLLGAWSCSACHDAYDRRSHLGLERDFVEASFLRGVMRTQKILIDEGVVKW